MSFLISTFVGYLQTSRIKCNKQCKLGQSFLFYFTSSGTGDGQDKFPGAGGFGMGER